MEDADAYRALAEECERLMALTGAAEIRAALAMLRDDYRALATALPLLAPDDDADGGGDGDAAGSDRR